MAAAITEQQTQHTPGPWTIQAYGDGDALVIHKDSERRVCFMATPGSHGDPAVIEADAQLIAAAPAYAKAWSLVPAEIKERIFDTLHTMHDEWVTAAISSAEAR